MSSFGNILPAGGATGTPLNLQKRIARIKASINLDGKKILDCGCGPGYYLIEFINSGHDAYGIEYETAKVAEFQNNFPVQKTRIRQGDLENIQYPDNFFDVALYNEVLEHVPDDGKAISEGFRVLKPGGLIVIFSPNRLYPFESHSVKLKATGKTLPVYTPFIPYVPEAIGRKIFVYWARNYWPSELRRMVEAKGFKIIETDFVWQTFENISNMQPKGFAKVKPILRKISSFLERTPILESFGVSQFIIARKQVSDVRV